MAKRSVVVVSDDIDGSEGAETLGFTFAGVDYEIDLGPANTKAYGKARADADKVLEKARVEAARILAPFLNHATPVIPRKGPAVKRGKATTDKAQNKAIRAWAVKKGLDVAERGRIRADIVEQYHREAGKAK